MATKDKQAFLTNHLLAFGIAGDEPITNTLKLNEAGIIVDHANPEAQQTWTYEDSKLTIFDEDHETIATFDIKQDENGNFIMSERQRETFVKNILGKHMCSLQWISWKDFGSVTISQDTDKTIHVKGGQKSKTNSDYLDIDGTLTVVNPLHLKFEGEIITCVDYINNGKPVKRKGTYNFTIAGQRRYWRMQEMNNPKDGYCDYVDIYFD